MADLHEFIQQARQRGLSDDQIRHSLEAQGWNPAEVTVALTGLDVPRPDQATPFSPAPHESTQPSLNPLMAALHHVLLWFFTGSSTVTIIGVVASLTGLDVSTNALASMIAVTIITFIPYAILFIFYLRRVKREPHLIPGKVWSIITICFHSIGAMIAAIALVVNAIVAPEASVLISAGLVLILDICVAVTYIFATFASPRLDRVKRIIIKSFIPLLGILFGILFVLSILQLGPSKHDETLRSNLVATVQSIVDYTSVNDTLPTVGTSVVKGEGIEYNKKSNTTYELCATFESHLRTDTNTASQVSPQTPHHDSYVSESDFRAGAGRQCFTFASFSLENSSRINSLPMQYNQ